MHKIYETLIDYGAHPNMAGVLTTLSKTETRDQQNFKVRILFAEQMTMAFALRMAARSCRWRSESLSINLSRTIQDHGAR
jgi:hypothetical protein